MRLALAALLLVISAVRAAGDEAFDAAVDGAVPSVARRATVIIADRQPDGTLTFRATHYKGEGDANDFWPASTIKLYAALAALELVHELGLPLDVSVTFEHRDAAGKWVLDCARTMKEMLSEVFVRSSNEDYTLLLRMTGRDRINGKFLTPERGFKKSALMRGYVTRRPYAYLPEEAQRITFRAADGVTKTVEHTWCGRVWSEERGATVFDAKTGNCTSTAEMADCLRRLMFHESIPEAERFRISQEMADFVRYGANGLCGLETKGKDSGPYAWTASGEAVYPAARYFHKCGRISNYVLDLACLDDRAQSGRAVILATSANTGEVAPMQAMCKALLEWAKKQETK
ncbi:MAG TPA: serine hydrolase [Verrucomicrobiales bacterium]|jgi:hypothetical protein|nr:serine hydrolase [Verrucomicrobiales bacterium]